MSVITCSSIAVTQQRRVIIYSSAPVTNDFQKVSAETKRRLTGSASETEHQWQNFENLLNKSAHGNAMESSNRCAITCSSIAVKQQRRVMIYSNTPATSDFQKVSAEAKRRLTGLVSVAQRSRRRSEHAVTRF